jgi:hypothetical protein
MGIILSCLLLAFLTACQSTASSPKFAALTNVLPPEKWEAKSYSSDGNLVGYKCPAEKCGEKIVVTAGRVPARSAGGITQEEYFGLRTVSAEHIKEFLNLCLSKGLPGDLVAQITSVRKLSNPVGFSFEGNASSDSERAVMVGEVRLHSNETDLRMVVARNPSTAHRTLALIPPPRLLK